MYMFIQNYITGNSPLLSWACKKEKEKKVKELLQGLENKWKKKWKKCKEIKNSDDIVTAIRQNFQIYKYIWTKCNSIYQECLNNSNYLSVRYLLACTIVSPWKGNS